MAARAPDSMLGRLLALALIGGVLAASGAIAGCGGGSEANEDGAATTETTTGETAGDAPPTGATESSAAYEQILRGLEQAAQADSGYNALRRAEQLDVAERAVVESFCNFAWQIGVNREAAKLDEHAYLVARIRNSAEFDLDETYSAEVETAMGELRDVIDLTALDGGLVARYKKACET
jgi:hypothetical protein